MRDRTSRQHATLMQNHDVVFLRDLVDEMRRPKRAHALRRKRADVAENSPSRLDVETGRWLIQQQ